MALYAIGFGGLLLAFGVALRSRDRRRRVVTAGVPLMIGDAPGAAGPASSAVVERVAPHGGAGLTAHPV
jgi:hypothetical protein